MAKFDAYQMATDRITALLEQGVKPWAQPWVCSLNCAWSGSTGKPYSLLNQMLLIDPHIHNLEEAMADVRGEWVTYKQAQQRGGHVKAGEKGRKVVFYSPMEITEEVDGQEVKKTIPYLTAYTVFKVTQCEGLTQKYHNEDTPAFAFKGDAGAQEVADGYLLRSGVKYAPVRGSQAYYRPSTDTVVTPLPEQFEQPAEYYSTLFHELTHSTGHPSRLNRLDSTAAFGNEVYSLEELVAEIGSASLLATIGVETPDSLNNSAAYIGNWLKALKNDKRMIVRAAGRAEKAVRLILGLEAA